jgi:hypothetical protein
MDESRKLLDRRQALGALGALGIGAIAAACSSNKTPSSAAGTSTSTTLGSSSAACTLTPEATEGPFYLDINDVRRDITEG